MFAQWKTFFRFIGRYSRSYGGICNAISSPFFGIAFIVSALNYATWADPSWTGKVESLIPSLLGFSLGTYAILFSIIGSRLKGALRQTKTQHGVDNLEALNATFFHFIFVQVFTLIWAFLYQGNWWADLIDTFKSRWEWLSQVHYWTSKTGAFFGYLLLVYSITLMVAAAIAVYRLAMIRDPNEDAES
jgi:hypothetical protein